MSPSGWITRFGPSVATAGAVDAVAERAASVRDNSARSASVAFTARREVDQSYARCLRVLMDGPGYPMLATHDPRLIEIAGSPTVVRSSRQATPRKLSHDSTPLRIRHASSSESVMNRMLLDEL